MRQPLACLPALLQLEDTTASLKEAIEMAGNLMAGQVVDEQEEHEEEEEEESEAEEEGEEGSAGPL